MSSGPNLSSDDYEKLEAEQHYYKEQLDAKSSHRIGLIDKKNYSALKLEAFKLKMSHVRDGIEYKKRRILQLRKVMKHRLDYDRTMINRINKNKKIISNYRSEIHQFDRDKMYKDYEDWMKKIAMMLKQVKRLGQSLSALKTNLILHGRNIELAANDDIEILDKIVDKPSQDRRCPSNTIMNH